MRDEAAEYYRLKTDAVDALVNADVSNSPVVSAAELRKYKSQSRWRLSPAVKAILIKFWFAAALCFFFMWGTQLLDVLDTLFVLTVGGGLVTDLLTNNALRFVAAGPGSNDKFMMYPGKRKFVTLPLNILHSGIVVWLTYSAYNIINVYAQTLFSMPEDSYFLGVEPLGFGLIYTALDLIIIGMKRLLCSIINDAKLANKN